MTKRDYCVDFDDLCDEVRGKLRYLLALKEKLPEFKCTLFTIPQRTSDETIAEYKTYDWIQLAPHGWRHTRGECLSWNYDEAIEKITIARDRGIDAPVFRAPGWLLDADAYDACKELGYVVASHRVFRVPDTGAKEYVYNMSWSKHGSLRFRAVHGHMTRVRDNSIEDLSENGKLAFFPGGSYHYPQELACVF